jgi:hypothetical protein
MLSSKTLFSFFQEYSKKKLVKVVKLKVVYPHYNFTSGRFSWLTYRSEAVCPCSSIDYAFLLVYMCWNLLCLCVPFCYLSSTVGYCFSFPLNFHPSLVHCSLHCPYTFTYINFQWIIYLRLCLIAFSFLWISFHSPFPIVLP